MISPTSTARAPQFAVVVHEKGGAERREMFEATELTVGRVQGNELMLPKGNVSKRHARLLYRDGRFIVTDLNSTNGTYVNRRKITQATIVREGDRIYVGDFVLRIELSGEHDQGSADAASRPELGSLPDEISVVGASLGGSLRPASEEEDEHTRVPSPPQPVDAARLMLGSVPGSDPPVRVGELAPNETTGTHHVGRVTEDDSVNYDRGALLSSQVARAVQGVVERLGLEPLGFLADEQLAERVDEALREVIARLGGSGEAPVSAAPERLFELARAELLQLGVLGGLLEDVSVTQIGVLRYDQVVVVRAGRSVAVEPGFSSERALSWALRRLLLEAGEVTSEVEYRLPTGARVSVDAARTGKAASVLIRKPERTLLSLDELVRRGVISRAIATFFRHCLSGRANVLVVGGHDGSAEQLLGALAGSVSGDSRLVWVGDGVVGESEVSIDFGLGTVQQARRTLSVTAGIPGVRFAARLTHPEVTASVTEAVASGADGVLALRHATSLKRALGRLSAELSAARPGLGIRAARELLVGAYDVAIEVARLRDDRVRVLRVVELSGVLNDEIQLQDIFTFLPDRTAAGGAVEGTFAPSGTVPQVVEAMRARGENLDSGLFSRPPSR